jgi:hypothetical protein
MIEIFLVSIGGGFIGGLICLFVVLLLIITCRK